MNGRPWTPAEDAQLRRDFPSTPTQELANQIGRSYSSVCQRANKLGLKKSQEYKRSMQPGLLDGVKGTENRFKKGHEPWNKGLHYTAGGRSAETRFKPGSKPQTWVPVGTEVVDRDGYRKRKIRDDAPPGMSRQNWRYVHILVWEEHHGPVPKAHTVTFRNGDRSDIRIENLDLIHRRQLAQRNTVQRLPEELKQVIRLKAVVTRKINQRSKANGKKQNRRSA